MSNDPYTAKETSFWKFIQENEIEIPIIQRDYAQGRLGKEYLRKSFLMDLKKALDNEKPYNNKVMKLDFVYGSIVHQKMNLLDGQQRLTTLWLLHWYIALRAGKLGEVAKYLNRFSYETRISSREFCNNLCNPEHFTDYNGKDIVGFITKQTWFYSAWKQDPTIQSVLRMLGGTKITDKKGEVIIDGIEELFDETNDFEGYWTKLTSDNPPIVFYHLPLKDFGLSDDLYIKMNARGKQLNSFENFKADLVSYITEQSESELLDEEMQNNWRTLLNETNGIPIKMDTTWTDIFWKNKSNDNKIDEIYFAFLNRFFWNKLFMFKKYDGKYVLDIGKGDESSTQENENLSYKYLNNSEAGQNVYDTTIAYKELDVYKFFNNEIPYSVFEDLQKILDRNTEIPLCCEWDKSFNFIPKYEKDDYCTDNNGEKINKVTYLNQVQRVVFHAVCKYLIDGRADENSLKQWMRVVWNFVSGEDSQIYIYLIHTINNIFHRILDSHDIYNSLDKFTDSLSDSAFDRRCKEEITKAKQILHGKPRSDGKSWEDVIIEAEKTAFFKGAIRFLFQDANGFPNWDEFDKKWEKAQQYFDENGVKKDFRSNALLLRALLSRIKIGENWFGYSKEFWLTSLLNSNYQSAVHYLLTTDELVIDGACEQDWIKHKDLLKELLDCESTWHILYDWRGFSVLTRYSQRRSYAPMYKDIVVLNDIRNKLLNGDNVEISPELRVGKTTYLYGWGINFKYNDHFFQWDGTQNKKEVVYIMDDEWQQRKKHSNSLTDNVTDEDTHYCFVVESGMTSDQFINKLDELINNAFNQ